MAVRGAISNPTCEGTLTIASVVLNNAAWSVGDLWRLWGSQVDYRGTDRILPYAQGVVSYPRWRTALRLSLPTIITGHVNSSGVAAADPMSQLATNLRALLATVLPPDPATTAGTRAASLLLPNGTTLTGTVIPLGITPGAVVANVMRATFELVIPAGTLA